MYNTYIHTYIHICTQGTAGVMASNIAQQRDQLHLLQERVNEKTDEVTRPSPTPPPALHPPLPTSGDAQAAAILIMMLNIKL